jgi:hypothetical protein
LYDSIRKKMDVQLPMMMRREVYHPKGGSRPGLTLRHDASPTEGRQRSQGQLLRQKALSNVMGRLRSEDTVQAMPIELMCPEQANPIGA